MYYFVSLKSGIFGVEQFFKTKRSFVLLYRSGELTSLHSVDRHPGQPHIVATGSGDGVLGIWDLRQEKSPVSLLEAHAGPGQYSVQNSTGALLVVPW